MDAGRRKHRLSYSGRLIPAKRQAVALNLRKYAHDHRLNSPQTRHRAKQIEEEK
jgi:hypothetical protein